MEGRRLDKGVVATVAVSPLTITIGAQEVPSFQAWLATGAAPAPRSGSIQYMMPGMTNAWATLSLKGLVVRKISSAAPGFSKVEMSVGSVSFAPTP